MIDSLMTGVLTRETLRPLADALAESLSERNREVSALVGAADAQVIGDQQLDEWGVGIRAAPEGEDRSLAQDAIRQFVAKIVVHEKAGTLYATFPLSTRSKRIAFSR